MRNRCYEASLVGRRRRKTDGGSKNERERKEDSQSKGEEEESGRGRIKERERDFIIGVEMEIFINFQWARQLILLEYGKKRLKYTKITQYYLSFLHSSCQHSACIRYDVGISPIV